MRITKNHDKRYPCSQTLSIAMSLVFFVIIAQDSFAQQRNDPAFDSKVVRPVFTKRHPKVLIDAAHNNVFSVTTHRVEPLMELLRSDGFVVDTGREDFSDKALSPYELLVVLTAQNKDRAEDPAFTSAEEDAVHDWVNRGGSMLFCVDHQPFGASGKQLAERFGVKVFLGYVSDPVTADGWRKGDARTPVYTRNNSGLTDNTITRGRKNAERLQRVAVFGGESLTGPEGSSNLLQVSRSASNIGDGDQPGNGLGTSQAVALKEGRGRVVITADCSMWTAQLVTFEGKEQEYGMARHDLDNRQFAINVFRWLSGKLK